MAIETTPRRTVVVDTFTDGVLGPEVAQLGPVADGGHIVWNSAPGCMSSAIAPSKMFDCNDVGDESPSTSATSS